MRSRQSGQDSAKKKKNQQKFIFDEYKFIWSSTKQFKIFVYDTESQILDTKS